MILRVGFFQFNPEFAQVQKNLTKVLTALKGIHADLIVLPELPFTGYCFKDRKQLESLAEEVGDSATIDSLKTLCQEKNLHIVTGFAEKAAGKLFNSAVLVGPGKVLHTYRKLHLFNAEKTYFDPGDTPLEAVSAGDIKIGLMVCFDWAFPEVARILSLKGAQLICQPANLVLAYCQQAMLTRSLENAVFTVTANRHGTEKHSHGRLTFTGQSQITDPQGNVLVRAEPDVDVLSVMEIDIDRASNKRMTDWNDLFADRRPEFYNELVKLAEDKRQVYPS